MNIQGAIAFIQDHWVAIAFTSFAALLRLLLFLRKRGDRKMFDGGIIREEPACDRERVAIVYRISYVPNPSDIPVICRKCAYVCGDRSGDRTLICALHPYGPEEGTCPDFEPDEPGHDA